MNRTLTIGRLVLTTARQMAEAPILDACATFDRDDTWRAHGWCIRPRPTEGRAVVVAWHGGRVLG